jgi:hypothetical protein
MESIESQIEESRNKHLFRSLANERKKRIVSLLVKGDEDYTGIVLEKDLVYKVVVKAWTQKLFLITSITTKNILSIEKMHPVSKRLL